MVMRAKFINEKFIEHSDPIKDMRIGIHNKLKSMYENGTPGYYLIKAKSKYEKGWFDSERAANYTDVHTAKFLMYDHDSDDSLEQYLIDKLGEWTYETSGKWDNYSVIHIDENGDEEIYSW